MFSINIPEKYKSGFSSLINLNQDQRQILFKTINSVPENTPLRKIAESIQGVLDLEKNILISIVEIIFSLMAAKEDANVTVEDFVDGLLNALEKTDDTNLTPDESFKFQLISFFGDENKIYTRTKASYLTSERDRLFLNARIITDIRPIFHDVDTNEIEAGIIIHNLKIEYNQNGERITEYFAIDLGDLNKLKEQISRAEAKEKKLRNLLKEMDIKFIDLNPEQK